jgi:hypothetical protein
MVSFHQMSHFPEQGQERSPEHPPMLQVRHKPTPKFDSNYCPKEKTFGTEYKESVVCESVTVYTPAIQPRLYKGTDASLKY